jgi:hypothetical protein
MRLAQILSKKQFYCGNDQLLGQNQYTFILATNMTTIWAVTTSIPSPHTANSGYGVCLVF